MSAIRLGSLVEHSFEISGEGPLAEAHNEANGVFVPTSAAVFFRDGDFDRIQIGGPKLNKVGAQLKSFGWTSWDADYLDPDDDFYIPQGQEMPEWAKVLVRNVMAHPFARPGITISEADH